MTQGEWIKELRLSKGLSQQALGECIYQSKSPSTNRTNVSKIENGRHKMTTQEIENYEKFFNVPPGSIASMNFTKEEKKKGYEAFKKATQNNPYINSTKEEGDKAQMEQLEKELETLKEHYANLKAKYDELAKKAEELEKEKAERKEYADKFVNIITENHKLKNALVKMTLERLAE